MNKALTYFLRSSLIPKLRADVAARSACNIHLVLVSVSAVRTLPNQLAVLLYDIDLSVPTANLAVVRFCIQFGIDDVVVDETDDCQHCLQIILEIRHFYIAYGSTGRKRLKLSFESQFAERVDLLGDMDVIGVRNIALVRNALDHAESLL